MDWRKTLWVYRLNFRRPPVNFTWIAASEEKRNVPTAQSVARLRRQLFAYTIALLQYLDGKVTRWVLVLVNCEVLDTHCYRVHPYNRHLSLFKRT